MRSPSFVRALFVPFVFAVVMAPEAGRAQTAPPPDMAAVESARSSACVGEIAQVADMDARAAPYAQRVQRIQALARAIALEDTADVAPFDTLDAMERGVRDWFRKDQGLALRIVAGESGLVAERDTARKAIRTRLQEEMDSVTTQAQTKLADAQDVQSRAQPCQNAIFVRPAVVKACATGSGPLCDAVKLPPDSAAKVSPFRFVNAAEDLWDVVQLRPWTDPGPLQAASDGSLIGARTAARARRGNVVVAVALAPLIQARSQLDSTGIAEFQANLDSLGFAFDHPDFVMAPALEVQASVPAPIGGETLYLLHFGEVADPDVVWSVQADSTGGVVQAAFPAKPALLDRLKAGDPLSFTALKVPEGTTEGTPIYSLTLPNVNQGKASTALLGYMQSGDLNRDLKALAPPKGGG